MPPEGELEGVDINCIKCGSSYRLGKIQDILKTCNKFSTCIMDFPPLEIFKNMLIHQKSFKYMKRYSFDTS